ncbi:hypothetical protein CR513_61627, partial [Mucuna pruriens]
MAITFILGVVPRRGPYYQRINTNFFMEPFLFHVLLTLFMILRNVFQGNHFRIFNILQELHFIKQDDHNFSTFFIDLKSLWEELESLRPTSYFCDSPYPCVAT